MLAKRIIPCLDIKDGRVVKGVKFLGLKDAGDPVEVAKAYDQQQADELVFLDITASFQQRKTLVELVERIAKNIFMPFTVGGGIGSINDIRDLLNAGAEKVSINTAAVKCPDLVNDASAKFGSQCIVVAIDAKLSTDDYRLSTKHWQVYINGGRTPTNLEAAGGAGRPEHFYQVFAEAGADAGLAASIFHYAEYSVKEVKEYLKERGIPVR